MAFFLWNLPGMIVLTICGVLLAEFVNPDDPPFWLVGLPPAAISLVFKAFYGFGAKLDTLGIVLALISSLIAILINNDARISPSASQWVFPVTLACGAIVTYIDHKRAKPWGTYRSPGAGWDRESDETMKRIGIPLWAGASIIFLWAAILVLVIVLKKVANVDNVYLTIFETMYRIGSIIFGGGQVVLPMLQDEVVPGWMTKDQFLQGLGIAQSMPGPLFNFAAYLGAVYMGVPGALIAWCGLFGPGVILIFGAVRTLNTLVYLPIPMVAHLCFRPLQSFLSFFHSFFFTTGSFLGPSSSHYCIQGYFEWTQCYCDWIGGCGLCDFVGISD